MRMIILISVYDFIICDFHMCIVSIFFSPTVESILYLYIHRFYTQILCRCKFSFYIHICVDSRLDYYIRMEEINLDYLELSINIYVLLRSITSEFSEGLFNFTHWLWWVSYMLISNLHPNSYFVSWKYGLDITVIT